MGYKYAETIAEVKAALTSIDTLYQAQCIKWGGKTSDTKEYYSEVMANELLLNLIAFSKFSKVTRSGTYCREDHCHVAMDLCESNREEEMFAKRITGLRLPEIGIVLDYQVPLKNTSKDIGLGKIDMISFNEETDTLHLIELKYEKNNETLLRAILESYTYYKRIDQNKMKDDYVIDYKFKNRKAFNETNPVKIKVVPSVLVTSGCKPFKELQDMVIGKRPNLKALSLALGVKVYRIAIDVS
jgi:hypothetical protein